MKINNISKLKNQFIIKKLFLITAAVLFGLGAQNAGAQTSDMKMFELDEGTKAYNSKDYAKAAAKGDEESIKKVKEMDMNIAHSNAYNKPNRLAGTKWAVADRGIDEEAGGLNILVKTVMSLLITVR